MAEATLPKQEWIDAKTAHRIFGIGKTTLYALAEGGKIRTSSLRERGKLRGKRLFSYDSISAHIEAQATGPKPEAAAGKRGNR